MPRYYFDVWQNGQITEDIEGEELPDPAAAEQEAALAAVHLSKELFSGSRDELAVEVRDEQGQPVVRAKVSLEVERP
jgi:hypothetical protein